MNGLGTPLYSCNAISGDHQGQGYWFTSNQKMPPCPSVVTCSPGYVAGSNIGAIGYQGTGALPAGGCTNSVLYNLNLPIVGVSGAGTTAESSKTRSLDGGQR